jgi:hypothetical protein
MSKLLAMLKSITRGIRMTLIPMDVFNWKIDYMNKNNIQVDERGSWEKANNAFNRYLKGEDV